MRSKAFVHWLVIASVISLVITAVPVWGRGLDIRGVWQGKAQGAIFGAEGSVTITSQKGEEISGIVEGGNVFGTAKFGIKGMIKGNAIIGNMDGHTFQGIVHPDGTIRGAMKASNGEVYEVFLRRSDPYWGTAPYGPPQGTPFGGAQGAPYGSPPGFPYGMPYGIPYGDW